MRILLTLLLGGLLNSETLAQMLLEEHFDYVAGTSLAGQTNPASGQTWALVAPASGANIAPPTIGSGSLSHPNLAPSSGNSALTDRTQSGTSRIALASGQVAGTVFYSALVRVNDFTNLTNTTTGSFFAGMNVSSGPATALNTAVAPLLIHRDLDNATAFNLGIGVSNDNSDRVFDTTEFAQSDTVFVVASYTFNPDADDDVARLWINPAPATFGAPAPPAETISSLANLSAFSSDTSALNSFFVRNNGVEPAQMQIDEVRVDLTWAAVTPVPEPASATLAALSMVGFMARRHRRSSA